MKKQGDFYLKLTSILLAALLAVYVVCSLFFDSGPAYSLETAVYCEVGDGISVSGFVVRSERYVVTTAPIVVTERMEGQWVGSGQAVAMGYSTGQARADSEELSALQAQRAQLLLAAEGADSGNTAHLDREISNYIVTLSQQTVAQNFDAMSNLAETLEPLILRRCVSGDDIAQINDCIERLDERIAVLTQKVSGDCIPVVVSSSGYFSAVTDGYEEILTPEMLRSLNLAQLRTLDKQSGTVPEQAIGRLITGQTWYYVTEIPEERTAEYEKGSRLEVSFAGTELQELRMTVEYIGEPENGNCLLVLSCNKKMQCVTALRKQSASIVFDSYAGLRIPKSAIYYVDGETGVYILSGARAKWKPVEILYEYGDDYLVAWDSSDTDHLWPRDEVILTAEEITDGMVME